MTLEQAARKALIALKDLTPEVSGELRQYAEGVATELAEALVDHSRGVVRPRLRLIKGGLGA